MQIAVALYHLGNHNWRGAVTLLGEGIKKLRYYQPTYVDIDVDKLVEESAQLLSALQQAGAEKIAEFVQHFETTDTYPGDDTTLPVPKIVKTIS